ncbi:hypothetical protein GCM10027181_23450 [Rheinheimera gaetbuli]
MLLILTWTSQAEMSLSDSISKIKPSIVAIGVHDPLGSPRVRLTGTGFVVADGKKIVTNYHVIAPVLSAVRNERYVVLSGTGSDIQMHSITQTKTAPAYDLAVLSIDTALPSTELADAKLRVEGTEIAFTGFPITNVLGLYPATHKGIISAITPIAAPADNSSQLQTAALLRLKQPYMVYQLDATAYPGNSGSPLYDARTAQVIGIINKVFVKSTREAVLSDPSAISYAIPVQFLLPLLAD